MYDHSWHRGKKHFCRYCLHAFITEDILKRHIKYSFKVNGKQLRCLKKVDMLNSKILKENDVKVRDHCHITGKYRDSAHRDCNINVKLNSCSISQPKKL